LCDWSSDVCSSDLEQVESGNVAAAFVAACDGFPKIGRAFDHLRIAPEGVAAFLAGVLGFALAARRSVEIQDAVDAGLFGPVDDAVEPCPATRQIFARSGIVFEQPISERHAHVIEPEIADAPEIVAGDPIRAPCLNYPLGVGFAEALREGIEKPALIAEFEAGKVAFHHEPRAEVDA